MRRSLVVSLVLSNAASAVNSLSRKGEIHSLLRNNIDAYRNAVFSEATTLRRLQVTGGNESTCNADGSVNFDDGFDTAAFDAQYDPICTCDEESNMATILATLSNLTKPNSTEDFQGFADAFNEAVGNLSGRTEYECVNGCETCFDEICGILETSQKVTFSARPVNFTVEQIFVTGLDSLTFDQLIEQASFYSSVCITYTENETGTLCIGGEADNFTAGDLNATTLPCFIEYNGEMCNSCVSQLPSTEGQDTCVVANCTNINPNATVDTCAGTGYVGPFRFINAYDENGANGTISLGSCNVSVPAPAPSTMESPTAGEAPTAASPTPAMEPSAVYEAPTAAPPTTTMEPSTDVKSPTGSTPTTKPPTDGETPTAPIPAPTITVGETPTAPTPASNSGAAVMTGFRATWLALLIAATCFF
jgi:hypothetical protein